MIESINNGLVLADGTPVNIPKIETTETENIPIEERGLQLPEIKGYKLLCAIPDASDKYESGILKAGDTKRIEENATVVLFVLKVGDMAYKDETRFPTGPWCKEGDFILTRAYAEIGRAHV